MMTMDVDIVVLKCRNVIGFERERERERFYSLRVVHKITLYKYFNIIRAILLGFLMVTSPFFDVVF